MIDDDLLYDWRGKEIEVWPRGAWDGERGTLVIANAVGVKLRRASDGKVLVLPWVAIERVVAS